MGMSKFKVGDKVMRLNYNHSSLQVGDVGIVKRVFGDFVEIEGEEDLYSHRDENLELVTEGPVRTVTRREVVQGKFGPVEVGMVQNGEIAVYISGFKKPDELRSAAMILSQIAEAMDDGESK